MPTRKFSDYAVSGLIEAIYIGGVTSEYKALTAISDATITGNWTFDNDSGVTFASGTELNLSASSHLIWNDGDRITVTDGYGNFNIRNNNDGLTYVDTGKAASFEFHDGDDSANPNLKLYCYDTQAASTALSAGTSTVFSWGGVGGFTSGANITVDKDNKSSSPILYLTGDEGYAKTIIYQTEGSDRWRINCNNTSETGGNAGSNLAIGRYDDAGIFLDQPLIIERATGIATFVSDVHAGALMLDANQGIYFEDRHHCMTWNDGSGNFNIRVGHDENEVCTEAGFALQDEWSQGSGWREFNVSSASLAVDDPITWRKQLKYDTNSVYLSYQGSQVVQTSSDGVTILSGNDLIINNGANDVQVMKFSGVNNAGTTADIYFNGNGVIAADSGVFISIDATNTSTTQKFVVGRDAQSSNTTKLFEVGENGLIFGFGGAESTARVVTTFDGTNGATKLDGKICPYSQDSAYFNAQDGMYGGYHYANNEKWMTIWGMGNQYVLDADGFGTGDFYGFAFAHTSNADVALLSGNAGNFAMYHLTNGVIDSGIGSNLWTKNGVYAGGDIYENDTLLSSTYAGLASANTFTDVQTISVNADPAFIIKSSTLSSQDTQIEIRGARNGDTSRDTSNILFTNYDSDNSASYSFGMIGVGMENATTHEGHMGFWVASVEDTLTERLTIASDGTITINGPGSNDGILQGNGSSNPAYSLYFNFTAGTGSSNTNNYCIGDAAGNGITTGYRNNFIGSSPGLNCTTGTENIGIGTQATLGNGTSKLTGSNNIGIGYQAVWAITSADYNIGIGYQALRDINVGHSNLALGRQSMENFTSGIGNVSLGWNSLFGDPTNGGTGDYNVSIGYYAGNYLINGDNNTFLGCQAGRYIDAVTNGYGNIAIGYQSLMGASASETNGYNNIGIGSLTGSALTSGHSNVNIGYGSGNALVNGYQNTNVGNAAGNTVTSGYTNTFIGNQADADDAAAINRTAIGNGAVALTNHDFVLGNSSVDRLECQVQTISALSDERDKIDITPLALGLNFINKVETVNFRADNRDRYEDGISDQSKASEKVQHGVIAQQIEKITDEMDVYFAGLEKPTEKRDVYRMAYGYFIPVLINAVQEMSAKIDTMQQEINTLKGK
jgi:hypothetical protein